MTRRTIIDLRSDTVTLPSPAMRRAMADSELGDDVYGEDPTVNRLEAIAAEAVGKEAALLVPSGTMANLTALLTHCERGRTVICGDRSHIFRSELGGASALGGLIYRPVRNADDGCLDEAELYAAFTPGGSHDPLNGVVCLENTHNYCAGAVLGVEYTQYVAGIAHERGVPLHLDGARIFNAAVALGMAARELTAPADSVSFCLSKGLAAPVGSLICGTAEFVQRARRVRKMLGGGMRQAGVLAAAGIVALTEMVERLAEDHENARLLAQGLDELPGVRALPAPTNIVIVSVSGIAPAEFARRAAAEGVLCSPFGEGRIRFVTHYGIGRADIEDAVARLRAIVQVPA